MYNINDNAAAIRVIQKYLAKIFEDTFYISQNGVFDENTILALNRFQKENNLEIKDYVDYTAFTAIFDAYSNAKLIDIVKTNTPHIDFPISRGMQSSEIYKINSMLAEILRYYSVFELLPVTNYFSAETENAIKLLSSILDIEEQTQIDEIFYYKMLNEHKSIKSIINAKDEYFPD